MTVKVTLLLLHWPESAATTILVGQLIIGSCVSRTVTVNEQPLVLPTSSVAVQVTLLVPTLNVEPLGGTHTTTTVVSQLSVAVATQVTLLLLHWPASATSTILLGQVISGGTSSTTVIVKEQLAPLELVQVTVFVPAGKDDPEGGTHVTPPPHSPVRVGSGYVTTALQSFEATFTTMLVGQTMSHANTLTVKL